jgi:3-oxoacyl-[acyl-carrier-protein] synthase II
MAEVVVTGIGLVTPLGCAADDILRAVERDETAAQPSPFSPPLACPLYAPVRDFAAARYFPENKTLRLMNRDAQMAVVAARLAVGDAGIVPDAFYPAEEIALYGATGLAGMPADEIARLVESAAAADGSLDLRRFGEVALKRIRPVLSFKILANMPICFVSIFENIRGLNAVYTPWEGQGAQAIAAGVQAIADGDVPCALVGACDVKTHAFSFAALDQFGVWDSWNRHGAGSIPGEGAAFLVLEERALAMRRGARVYAGIRSHVIRSVVAGDSLADALSDVFGALEVVGKPLVVAAQDGDADISHAEQTAIERAGLAGCELICPKKHAGNLFAAAAGVQVALAAALAAQRNASSSVLANCFGYGSEQASFLLEAV